jgi:hypothetical protein
MRICHLHLVGYVSVTFVMLPQLSRPRPAVADAPIISGDDDRIESRNRKFVALPSKDRKETIIYDRTVRQREIWRMPGWEESGSLSDDGDYLVRSSPHSNLIDLDYKPDLTMLAFYRRGTLIRKVPLSELIRDFRSMPRSVSHYFWGYYLGLSALHRYDVHTVEGRLISYDITTGQPVRNQPRPMAK